MRSRSSAATPASEYHDAGSVQPSSSGCSSGGTAGDGWESAAHGPDCLVSQGIGGPLHRSRYRSRWSENEPRRHRPAADRPEHPHPRGCLPRDRPRGRARAADGARRRGGGRLEGARPLLLRDPPGAAPQCLRVLGAALAGGDRRRARDRLDRVPPGSSGCCSSASTRRSPFSEQRALGNEVWSSLRSDEELRPVVERSYRAWLGRVVDLIEEGKADGSIAARRRRDVRRLAARGGGGRLRLAALPRRSSTATRPPADARDDRPRAGAVDGRLTDVLVLGAGLAGLAAARDLASAAPMSRCSRRGSASAGASSSSGSTTAARCSSAARSSGRSTRRISGSSRSSA